MAGDGHVSLKPKQEKALVGYVPAKQGADERTCLERAVHWLMAALAKQHGPELFAHKDKGNMFRPAKRGGTDDPEGEFCKLFNPKEDINYDSLIACLGQDFNATMAPMSWSNAKGGFKVELFKQTTGKFIVRLEVEHDWTSVKDHHAIAYDSDLGLLKDCLGEADCIQVEEEDRQFSPTPTTKEKRNCLAMIKALAPIYKEVATMKLVDVYKLEPLSLSARG